MNHQSLARKYRPQNFRDIKGQELILAALKGGLLSRKLPQSIIFSGTRGTGKTTLCRITAKALNCVSPKDGFDPCNKCEACNLISSGFGYIEIDGASYTGVDMVRDLLQTFPTLPPKPLNKKVYVIDEAHMLSNSAFNALLKSIEEPPPHIYLFLVTTEPQKIPDTIKSRCVNLELLDISKKDILERLEVVCKSEQIEASDQLLNSIAQLAQGSMRDALTLLDNFVLLKMANEENLFLAYLEKRYDVKFFDCLEAVFLGDFEAFRSSFRFLLDQLTDVDFILKNLMTLTHEFLVYFCSVNPTTGDLKDQKFKALKMIFKSAPVAEVVSFCNKFLRIAESALRSFLKDIIFEAGVLNLIYQNSQQAVTVSEPVQNQPAVFEDKTALKDQNQQSFLLNEAKKSNPRLAKLLENCSLELVFGESRLIAKITGGVLTLNMLKKQANDLKAILKSAWPQYQEFGLEFLEERTPPQKIQPAESTLNTPSAESSSIEQALLEVADIVSKN